MLRTTVPHTFLNRMICRQQWSCRQQFSPPLCGVTHGPTDPFTGAGQIWRQNNAAEHNDSCSGCIFTGRRGPCDCRAVRGFCLPRGICSGAETGTHNALDALALSVRTTDRRYDAVLWSILQTLPKFAKSPQFEITLEFDAGLESRLRLSDRYQR